MNLNQSPPPGSYVLLHKGDTCTFTLETAGTPDGSAWIRTNISHTHTRYLEIIRHVEENRPILSHDWHDIPMKRTGDGIYSATLPMPEVGRFEAKAFFLPPGSDEPIWARGHNVVIKVEPTDYVCANTIYTAFIRQFSPNMYHDSIPHDRKRSIRTLEKEGFSVIPASGTFRNLAKQLDFIMGTLRFRIIQLLPVFPVPTTYGRMGKFGSPFASLDFLDVDSSYAELDRRTTPLEQFTELADGIHARHGKLFLDLPINHTGWGSKLQNEHPEWFARGEDRSFESPGAWGVTWKDLAKLDYSHPGLWKYIADVFIFWCRHGVNGFRCDAGYMVPVDAWEYIVAKVRDRYPDTIFLLEGLGGAWQATEALLGKANIDWAYSELFQNYDRNQVENYLPYSIGISSSRGLMVHFAETHDNNRLASTSKDYSLMRTAFCALCSQNGGFGITNGVEWFADDKLDVHGAPPLNWENPENQVHHLARLNTILESHPCFHPEARLKPIQKGSSNVIVLSRTVPDTDDMLIIAANLDHEKAQDAEWPDEESFETVDCIDLLGGKKPTLSKKRNNVTCPLEPAQVLCLSSKHSDLEKIERAMQEHTMLPERTIKQRTKAMMMEVCAFFGSETDMVACDKAEMEKRLLEDPAAFCAEISKSPLPPVVSWSYPGDTRRTVVVPPGFILYASAAHPFTIELEQDGKLLHCASSIPDSAGTHFVLACPPERSPGQTANCSLKTIIYEDGVKMESNSGLLYLADPKADPKAASVRNFFRKEEIISRNIYAICTNGRGGMAQVRGNWASVKSQYDAFLAANLDPNIPVDRTVMLTRFRAWLKCRGYSQDIDKDCLETFSRNTEGCLAWTFKTPAGQGKTTHLEIRLEMTGGSNTITLEIIRHKASAEDTDSLDDDVPVTIILRPDLEYRINHEKTKAYTGPETSWSEAVSLHDEGFTFKPGDHRLDVNMENATFKRETEWQYMVQHPLDAERGLGECSDLFSPGYFSFELKAGESAVLQASTDSDLPRPPSSKNDKTRPGYGTLTGALRDAIAQFVVKRNGGKTVIAGYPWFLDWGRDTLICLRGMIAADMLDESRDILRQFAMFERDGTLPNMIHGKNDSNRDTSDAPLWFFTACADLHKKDGKGLMEMDCAGRPLKDVLKSIADNYIKGTPNGIRVDPDSGLVFSPPHFTWMDTNHPACTPREGYPVEVQALWHAALRFLSEIDPDKRWPALAEKTKSSIKTFFPIAPSFQFPISSFLSDCLNAKSGQSAALAEPDERLRPNQLLTITLGVIDDQVLARGIIRTCEELIVPGAIRSLADRPNKDQFPYRGSYRGGEDTDRKPAYHNGTAWTWLFPSYCEALAMVYGDKARNGALALLCSATELINRDCIGHVPEIVDGDSPHPARGCGAQAWGASELYRIFSFLV